MASDIQLNFLPLEPNDFRFQIHRKPYDQKGKADANTHVYDNFEPNKDNDIGIYLYKLHGSIDWERMPEKGNVLEKRKHPGPKSELKFGTDDKLTSIDRY